MPDPAPTPANPPTPPATPPPATPPPAPAPPAPPADELDEGDLTGVNAAGRKVINDMAAQRRQERQRTRTAEQQVTALQTENEGLRRQLGVVATLKQGVLANAVAAAAAGRLADPLDAMRLIDVSDLEVGDDGKVDNAKLKERIDALIKDKPYLSAAPNRQPAPLPGNGANRQPAPLGNEFNDAIRQAVRGS